MQRQYLHVAVIFPPALAGKDDPRKHGQKWWWNFFFFLIPNQGGCGTKLLVVYAHFALAVRGKLGSEVQLWKKSKQW